MVCIKVTIIEAAQEIKHEQTLNKIDEFCYNNNCTIWNISALRLYKNGLDLLINAFQRQDNKIHILIIKQDATDAYKVQIFGLVPKGIKQDEFQSFKSMLNDAWYSALEYIMS